jgi:hypothetical protein
MIKYLGFIAAAFVISGCATEVANPANAPTNPTINVSVTTKQPDNFDKLGEGTATVTRTTWNAVSDVAGYVKDKAIETNDKYNTPENRQSIVDAAKAAKDKTVKIYNTVRE